MGLVFAVYTFLLLIEYVFWYFFHTFLYSLFAGLMALSSFPEKFLEMRDSLVRCRYSHSFSPVQAHSRTVHTHSL